MTIEPLATIIAWVIGICAIIFFPLALIAFFVFLFKVLKND